MYTFVHHMQIIKCCILEIIEWNTSSAPCCFDQSRLEHSCLPRLWDKVFRVSNYRKDHGWRRLNRFLDFIPCTFNSNQILTQIDVYVKPIDDVINATLKSLALLIISFMIFPKRVIKQYCLYPYFTKKYAQFAIG